MDLFSYKAGKLFCENIEVNTIPINTPYYLYSWGTIEQHYKKFYNAFKELNPLICFSVKSCNNLGLLRRLKDLGCGMDVVSGGELYFCEKSDVDFKKVVYAGVGKTTSEIEYAIDKEIRCINIESSQEFETIKKIALLRGKKANVALRVNPDAYDLKTHQKTNTGKKGGKFGIDFDSVISFFKKYGNDDLLKLDGLHFHIGSPIYSAEPYVKAINRIIDLVTELNDLGYKINSINIGGGYAASYGDAETLEWDSYANKIVPLLKPYADEGIQIIIEPGRSLIANASILVTSVLNIKHSGSKQIIFTDTGMNHLLRIALYDANHFLWPVVVDSKYMPSERKIDLKMDGLVQYDVAGPICESSDYLAKERLLPPMEQNEKIAVFTTGAYGYVMSSNYNGQPRPAEVLVESGQLKMIREKESYCDLIAKQLKEEII